MLLKLIIQIPCLNEETVLPIALGDLPRSLPGIDVLEWMIINDGSTDQTVEVAKANGVHHVVSFSQNRGLASAFMAGIDKCLDLGADIIVNTDADNQYCGADIAKLVEPIVAKRADYVIGARPIMETQHFSIVKKFLQKIGSWVVRKASNTCIPDAPSGFRAMSREVASRLNVYSKYTYTLETIIQSGSQGFSIQSVPIRTNKDLRPSKLLKSIRSYIQRSATTIIRIFMTYRPVFFFGVPGMVFLGAAIALGTRYLYFFCIGEGSGHVQSLILLAICSGVGFTLIVVGLVADLIRINRLLLEKIDYQVRKLNHKV